MVDGSINPQPGAVGSGGPSSKVKRKIDMASKLTGQDAAAPTKRQRVSRACDQCRTGREKCDGIQPTCFTCASSNRPCSYTANPKKRGIQPGYIRTLELTLAWTFMNVQGSEDTLRAMLMVEGGSDAAVVSGRDAEGSYKLHKRWSRSTVCKQIERLLSGSDSPDDKVAEDDARAAKEVDLSGPATQHRDWHSPPTSEGIPAPLARTTTRKQSTRASVVSDRHKVGVVPSMQTPSIPNTPVSTCLRLPPNLWRLFDIYFAFTHCWLPIAEKHDVLRTSYSYPEHGLDISAESPCSGDHAELWSVLALASYQDSGASNGHNSDRRYADLNRMYETARSLIPSERRAHAIGHVKALLLLAMIDLGGQRWSAAWLLVGHASRIAVDIELHLDQGSNGRVSTSTRRKHVFLACFILDTIISSQLGRLPYLRQEDIFAAGLLNEDGLEEWQPWEGCNGFQPDQPPQERSARSPSHMLSTFNQLVKLLGILNHRTVTGATGPDVGLQEPELELRGWTATLPAHCKLRTRRTEIPHTPQLLFLHLVYACVATMCGFHQGQPLTAKQSISDLLDQYTSTYTSAAIPPVSMSLIAMTGLSDRSSTRDSDVDNETMTHLTVMEKVWGAGDVYEASPTTLLEHTNGTPRVKGIANLPGTQQDCINTNSIGTMSDTVPPIGHQLPPANATTPISISSNLSPLAMAHYQAQMEPSKALPNAMQGIQTLGSNLAAAPANMRMAIPLQKASDLQILGNQPDYHQAYVPTNNLFQFESGFPDQDATDSVDMDGLFDELASLDGAERVDNQPQFMQNLGFAPDADLSAFFGSDYTQFDPLLTAYIQNGSVGQQLDVQSRPFDGG
ncbi:fungal-specific transcription factor domain-containing protein [Cryomyces antarcticus]|uniref:Zn(2)-C6 fungal-type domain-containing protein n=1 Tax=Cryomyces antarcticus TaxID=329879 RepID=A0ABR0KU90_9PEZI|nr:hypothetical protein LTR16_000968 [Cryomyces antarcticus]